MQNKNLKNISAHDNIIIKGAREHNLQNINVVLPRNKFIVITGISGSGKSSLAFDTIYAEGQRRYVESLSSYARQFLGTMKKPEVDYIEGLSPSISIDQKTTRSNPRSTVGTVTEIYDYLRLLYGRVGTPHCYKCGKEISQQTPGQIAESIITCEENEKIQILAPIVKNRKGEHKKLLEEYQKKGFARVRIDGIIFSLEDDIQLKKNIKHTIEIVIDRLKVVNTDNFRKRLVESVETALNIGEDLLTITYDNKKKNDKNYSREFACPDCGINFTEITPRMFSFNNPQGACPECNGLGRKLKIDPDLVVPDKTLSLDDDAIKPWRSSNNQNTYNKQMLQGVAEYYNFSTTTPFEELSKKEQNILLYGTDDKIPFHFNKKGISHTITKKFEGVVNNLQRLFLETSSSYRRKAINRYMAEQPCTTCEGSRLKPEILAVTINELNIAQLTKLSITNCKKFFEDIKLSKREEYIAKEVIKEIRERLNFLDNVGLRYLTLSRTSGTLSGGEAQRIRLATQIGSGLVGVLYILDEPSIGLHQKDNQKLIETLKHLRDIGNTLVVVEHDEETMTASDYIVDIGPGAGEHGGQLIAEGTPEEIKKDPKSLTGKYLSKQKVIPIPEKRNKGKKKDITIKKACENNLKNIDVKFPLGKFICVTGVSGSGKSTLVNEILYKGLYEKINRTSQQPGKFKSITGSDNIDKIIIIDQSPIGRTPRSNPATYTGVFGPIRDLFAKTPLAKQRGYKPGRFSFNVKGGRCEACQGDGINKIEMHFLSDVYVPCEICEGKRYNQETLDVRYKGKNINDILEMTVEEALNFFKNIPTIYDKFKTLNDVGLGYIQIGQSSTTLSGGEAQRVKLAKELSRKSTGKTMYILDEPTTGLHFEDIKRLLKVLFKLRESGNTIVVIEHNLDVIKTADHIIDLGPDGGEYGGKIVASGTPEQVAKTKTYTGKYLKEILN
ncbi:MAG: excinuclease ABC subunit UvrA [Methanobacteriaceae archaeon]|nr:excinuclease ABC subunit UvrA [Methanobacteriaceae archaeon]